MIAAMVISVYFMFAAFGACIAATGLAIAVGKLTDAIGGLFK